MLKKEERSLLFCEVARLADHGSILLGLNFAAFELAKLTASINQKLKFSCSEKTC